MKTTLNLVVVFITTTFCLSFIETPAEPQQFVSYSGTIFAQDLFDSEQDILTSNEEMDKDILDEPMWFDLIHSADLVTIENEAGLGRLPVQNLFVQEPSNLQKVWICPQKPAIISI